MTQDLVIDIGGTSLRGAAAVEGGTSLASIRARPTPSAFGGEDDAVIVRRLLEELVLLSVDVGVAEPRRVVVGFPGPVTRDGDILAAPTVLGDQRPPEDLAQQLAALWPRAERVDVLNDVTAAGFAVADQFDDFAIVTVSSGIGSKVFLGSQARIGDGYGGEIGHSQVAHPFGEVLCECGGRDHLGAVASGRGIGLLAGRTGLVDPAAGDATTRRTLTRVLEGDPQAGLLVEETCRVLARSLAAIHAAVSLDAIVLMGGVVDHLGSWYVDAVQRAFGEATWTSTAQAGPRIIAHPSPLPGLAGAAAFLRTTTTPEYVA